MIGFFNSFELNNDEQYLDHAVKSWQFIKNHLLDKENGEWFWGVYADHSIMLNRDKAGFWKCPYHNTRACLEILERINWTNGIKISEKTFEKIN